MKDLGLIYGIVSSLIYIGLGGFLLAGYFLSEEYNTILAGFGLLVLIYGIFRMYRGIKKVLKD